MIDGLKPYPEHKDSGSKLHGKVPRHWRVLRIKAVLRESDQRTNDGLGTLLSLTRIRGLIPQKEASSRIHGAKTLVGYKRYKPGQIVMNRMQAWSGMFGTCKKEGLVSPDYAVFDIIGDHNARFLEYRIKAPDLVGQFALDSKGIGSGFNRLYSDRFGAIPITLPPPLEQAAIVKFLDHTYRRLNRAIRAKQKVIALLNEQKQVIIHRAVTRGLDPDVSLKPSGIPWLGDIPEHWEVWRIGRFAKVGNGSTPARSKPTYWHGGTYPWLNSSNVNRGFIDSADQFVTSIALTECHLPRVPSGSVLIAITGQGKTRGTAAILGIEATINQHIAYITPKPAVVIPEFLQLSLTGAYQTLRVLSNDSGSTKGALTCEDMKVFKLAIPPKVEQIKLVDDIGSATGKLDVSITYAERQIALLQEYRARLIADVVTGKLDVREVARGIPDELEADDLVVEDGESANGYGLLDSPDLTETGDLDEIGADILEYGTGANQ